MKESFQAPESPEVSRQEVVDAYKKLAEKGYGDPAELDMSDPEVEKANELHDKWLAQGDKIGTQDKEALMRHNVDKTMVNIDAGFHDKDYLEDALEWLMQDSEDAEKISEDQERNETRRIIANAIRKIQNLLREIE